ncbi:MAG: DUF4349 domain-containing protein [Mucilaginibacter sp.]
MKAKITITLLAGLALFAACKGRGGSEEFASSADTTTISPTGKSDTSKIETKLVKTADMRFKVKNVHQTSEKITALTTGYKGMVMHHQVESSGMRSVDIRKSEDSIIRVTSFSTTADITVKVPAERLDEFMTEVGRMGVILNVRRMDISDKSLEYMTARLKLKNRNDLIAQQKAGKVIIKNPTNVLALKDDMVDQQIGNKQIDDEVKNSIVSLSFYQSNTIYKEVIANDDPSAYNLPFFKRLGGCIENGWAIFENVVLELANLWVFVIAGIVVWMTVRYYRNKRPIVVIKP